MTSIDELSEYTVPTGDTQDGDGLPRIWWKYGNQAAKIPGFFYAKADDYDGPLPEPWFEAEVHDGEVGYKAETLRILPITKRSQPYTKDQTTGRRTYFDRWREGMQIHTELICFVEGIEGPVVFSYHGVTGTAMDGKGGIIPTASKALAAEASRLFKKKVGLSAFWLPIGPRLRTDGKVDFQKLAQGSIVNPPALRLPALSGKDLLNACYAGRELVEAAAAVREEYEGWRQERRANEPEPAPAAVGDGRNVPQPIGDDPFAPDEGDVI